MKLYRIDAQAVMQTVSGPATAADFSRAKAETRAHDVYDVPDRHPSLQPLTNES